MITHPNFPGLIRDVQVEIARIDAEVDALMQAREQAGRRLERLEYQADRYDRADIFDKYAIRQALEQVA